MTASAWIALVPSAPPCGAFAVAGAPIVERVLGGAYGGDVGDEVGRLVVLLAPWMVVSVGVNVTFPLAFVAERLRALPWIGAGALAVQVLLAWVGVELFELDGLALSLAVSTLLVLAALLVQLDAVERGLRGIAIAASRRQRACGCGLRAAEPRRRRPARRTRRTCDLRGARRPRSTARAQRVVVVPAGASLAAVR